MRPSAIIRLAMVAASWLALAGQVVWLWATRRLQQNIERQAAAPRSDGVIDYADTERWFDIAGAGTVLTATGLALFALAVVADMVIRLRAGANPGHSKPRDADHT